MSTIKELSDEVMTHDETECDWLCDEINVVIKKLQEFRDAHPEARHISIVEVWDGYDSMHNELIVSRPETSAETTRKQLKEKQEEARRAQEAHRREEKRKKEERVKAAKREADRLLVVATTAAARWDQAHRAQAEAEAALADYHAKR
jgi:hypothetical protein